MLLRTQVPLGVRSVAAQVPVSEAVAFRAAEDSSALDSDQLQLEIFWGSSRLVYHVWAGVAAPCPGVRQVVLSLAPLFIAPGLSIAPPFDCEAPHSVTKTGIFLDAARTPWAAIVLEQV